MKRKSGPPLSSLREGDEMAGHHVIDIRVFVGALFVGVVLMFTVGVGLGTGMPPQYSDRVEQHLLATKKLSDFGVGDMSETSSNLIEDRIPSGEHLTVDMREVDGDFLSNEVRLIHAMEKVVQLAEQPLLSHECQALEPGGVACAGVLLESRFSFHTWPHDGVILLDWFSAAPTSLVQMVEEIKNAFGIPTPPATKVDMQWYQVQRGVPSATNMNARHRTFLPTMDAMFEDSANMSEVVSIQSEHQRIDLWKLGEPNDTPAWSEVVKHNLQPGDPRLFTDELVDTDLCLFLDGKEVSGRDLNEEYAESLVHPTLFTHVDPRRVAIIDGAKNALLREVLKHKTVEMVTMLEVDPEVVSVVRQYMPMLFNCSDLVGSSDNCFDDSRVNMVHKDGKEWFITNYGETGRRKSSSDNDNKFEVIMIDLQKNSFESDVFTDDDYFSSMLDSLVEDGLIVTTLGRTPTINSPAPHMDLTPMREQFLLKLEGHPEVEAMLVYEEARAASSFWEVESYLLICKSRTCRTQWYARTDDIDYKIYERTLKTYSGRSVLVHYDGATHSAYQFPSKSWETYYCRREPPPPECAYRGLNLSAELRFLRESGEESDFYVKEADDGTPAVFASVPISKGDYIMPDDLARSLLVSGKSVEHLEKAGEQTKDASSADDFLSFIEKHGHKSVGTEEVLVEVGSTFLIRKVTNRADANIERMMPRPEVLPTFSPVYERRRRSLDVFLVATKDIDQHQEILKYDGVWD